GPAAVYRPEPLAETPSVFGGGLTPRFPRALLQRPPKGAKCQLHPTRAIDIAERISDCVFWVADHAQRYPNAGIQLERREEAAAARGLLRDLASTQGAGLFVVGPCSGQMYPQLDGASLT